MIAVIGAQTQFAVEVRAAPPACERSSLEYRDRMASLAQGNRSRQPGKTRADDVDMHAALRQAVAQCEP